MIKKFKIAAAFLLLICLCGCSVSGDIHLLQPPRGIGEREGIKSAVESSINGKISYKFPLSGEYRSAIILSDLDEDGSDEAVVFYKIINAADGSTHMTVLDRINNDWIVINDITGPGADIDKVEFCNLDGNKGREIVVGWSVYSNVMKTLRVYGFSGADFFEVPTSYLKPETLESTDIVYNEFVYGDFDSDSKDEVVTLELASAANRTRATAKLLEYYTNENTGEPFSTVTWTADIDNTVTSYLNVKACYINDVSAVTGGENGDTDNSGGLFAVIADGLNAKNELVTDIICWDSSAGSFKAPFYDSKAGTTAEFLRNTAVLSQDINGDGLVELPTAQFLPAYTEEQEERMYMINWNRYVSGGEQRLVPVMNAVYSSDGSYYVTVPDSWLGQITAKFDKTSSTLYFYTYDYKFQSLGAELFRIHECDEAEFEKLKEQEFIFLSKAGKKVYCARLQPETGAPFNINAGTVNSIFKLSETK